jgi:hypothetical protein
VAAKSPGNTSAIKGHFILTLGQDERSSVSGLNVDNTLSVSTGFSNPSITSFASTIVTAPQTATVPVINNLSFADNSEIINGSVCSSTFNGTTSSAVMTLRQTIVKNVGSKRIYACNIKSILNSRIFNPVANGGSYFVALYGKNGAYPTSLVDGTILGSLTLVTNDLNKQITIVSNDVDTFWDYVFVTISCPVITTIPTSVSISVGSVEFFERISFSNNRPEVTSFFAGRAWFAANSYSDRGTKIYFSQVIQRPEQIGLCYQKNDPTSEQFFDLLSDDGGYVSIPEIANVVALFNMRNAMVVLATNGTWVIRGGSSEGFSATNYRVEKVSGIGCVSRTSVTDVKGIPHWAGEDGIYTLEYDPNYNAFQQKSLSDERVRTYYQDIPANNRRFIKGTYDTTEQIVRYIYNSSSELAASDKYKYDKQLNYDINTKAWYPWTLPTTPLSLRGIVTVVDSNHVYEARVKYITTLEDAFTSSLSFAEQHQVALVDWLDFSTRFNNNPLDFRDYESFFVTAPMVETSIQKFMQTNYLFVYLDAIARSSCKVTPRFDWTSSGSSGKWGTVQEAYGTAVNYRNVTVRRLKIRGKGRSIQFKFGSTTGKPFSILGWSIMKSTNGDV